MLVFHTKLYWLIFFIVDRICCTSFIEGDFDQKDKTRIRTKRQISYQNDIKFTKMTNFDKIANISNEKTEILSKWRNTHPNNESQPGPSVHLWLRMKDRNWRRDWDTAEDSVEGDDAGGETEGWRARLMGRGWWWSLKGGCHGLYLHILPGSRPTTNFYPVVQRRPCFTTQHIIFNFFFQIWRTSSFLFLFTGVLNQS